MNINQLNYSLPKKYIAHSPIFPRDHSKLLILDRNSGKITHKYFHQLPDISTANDVLVFNETKVTPARIYGRKKTGGKVELLLIKPVSGFVWEVLGKNIPSVGKKVIFEKNIVAKVIGKHEKLSTLEFNVSRVKLLKFLDTSGYMPIPPYINKTRTHQIDFKGPLALRDAYQTVYAKYLGSIAAPTAGLHFTKKLLSSLKIHGISLAYLTLHIGLGTFEPIQEDDLTKHKMHEEFYQISPRVAQYLDEEKRKGKRIIAVGTTTARVLETLADENCKLKVENPNSSTSLFIYPPYKFKFVDAMITNFHLPKSTLLALISAFVSKPNTKHEFKNFSKSSVGKAYIEAKNKNYRFYSFGDTMFIQ